MAVKEAHSAETLAAPIGQRPSPVIGPFAVVALLSPGVPNDKEDHRILLMLFVIDTKQRWSRLPIDETYEIL